MRAYMPSRRLLFLLNHAYKRSIIIKIHQLVDRYHIQTAYSTPNSWPTTKHWRRCGRRTQHDFNNPWTWFWRKGWLTAQIDPIEVEWSNPRSWFAIREGGSHRVQSYKNRIFCKIIPACSCTENLKIICFRFFEKMTESLTLEHDTIEWLNGDCS